MTWFDSLILGIIQGITEFIPISSSGHLVLMEKFLGLDVSGLKSFDVVVHVGSLLAILIYFWADVWGMLKAFGRLVTLKLKKDDAYGKLILFIIIGTIPVVLLGYFGEEWLDNTFRNVTIVALWMVLVGFVFILGESVYKRTISKKKELKWWKALIIGFAQAVALVPGISRSGSTIVAGLFQGIERTYAARFSFLLGIPAIAGAGLLTALKISKSGVEVDNLPLLIGFLSSLFAGILSVHILMKFLKKHSLLFFAAYLIILGGSVLIL